MSFGKSLASTIMRVVDSILLSKWTSTPGIIESYDSETNRCQVKPVPRIKRRDGSNESHRIISNVPVVWNGGGGFTVLSKLSPGDSVLLVFCRRGISNFKLTFKEENSSGGVMASDAAVAIPCFGSLSVEGTDGISIQKNDGSVKVEVLDSTAEITTIGGTVTVKEDGKVYAKDFVIDDPASPANGVALSDHVHAIIQPSGSPSLGPEGPPAP